MPQTAPANSLVTLVPFIFMFAVFYFLLIRPQKTQEKERQKMLTALNKNDEVVTSGGIHGTIVNLKEKSVILRVDENVKIEVEKNCVAYKKSQGGSL